MAARVRSRLLGAGSLVAVTLVSVTLAAGCTDSPDETTAPVSAALSDELAVTTTAAPPTTVTPVDPVPAYLTAMLAGAPVEAVPGSDAALYAAHRSVASRLLASPDATSPDATSPEATSTVTATGTGYEVCGESCFTIDQIATDARDGTLVSFAVNGVPLAGRIAGGGLDATVDGVSARAVSAYRTDEALLVAVAIDNAGSADVDLFGFASTFRGVDAVSATEATGSWGAERVAAGSSGELLLAFPPGGPSGSVHLSGLLGGEALSLDVQIVAS